MAEDTKPWLKPVIEGKLTTEGYLSYACQLLERLVAKNGGNGGDGGDGGDGTPQPSISVSELIDPRATNWKYFIPRVITNEVLGVNKVYVIYKTDRDEYGTILVASITSNSPKMRLTIKAYDPTGDYLELSNTAQELYDLGRITSPTGIAFDLNRFDTASDIYTFELRAPWKGIPFHKKLEIFANNEDVSDKTISNTNINLVKML